MQQLFVRMAHTILHPLKSPGVSKDVEAQLFLSKGGEIEGKGGGVQGFIIVVAMTVASLSFLAMFSVPMGLEKEMGHAAAEAAMESFQFRVFVVMDAATFFSGMGVVALLLQGRSEDLMMVVVCRRVTYTAMGCQGLAFFAAALTFTMDP
jgi:hypothetical protein